MFQYPDENGFSEILKTIQSFNSFQEDNEVTFNQVVSHSIEKYAITGKVSVTGSDDFFIDQMDLQTILCNLMTNSHKAAEAIERKLDVQIKNNILGFTYEDNAGGFTDEQFKFFNQKNIKPSPGHEKHGLGILLIKILVEHHGGAFVIQRIPNGTRFEIKY
jgi:K+-sensing histidine kinase KdpD